MSGGNWLERGAALTGDAVEWLGDKTADKLEEVGWQGGANAVRSTANSAANRLGADVGEVELGQSDDPKQLVHGSASTLRTTAGHLSDFHAAFTRTGEGLKKLGTDGIKGAAADAFRDSVQEKAPRWFAAAAAFEAAAGAVGRFADTVTWAQGQAKEAIDEYKAAVKLSENAHAAYDTWVKDYESAVKAQQDPLPARPMGFTDPGTDGIESARQKLAEARRQRDDVAHSVAQALEKARDAAPKVSAADAALVELVRKGAEVEHFVGGIAKGTAGLVNFARGLDAHDPYNMNHPTVAQMGLNSMSAGFLTAANDPGAAAKAMLDSAMKDPFEFGGTLVPEAIGPKGGGLLSGAARRAAGLADDLPHTPKRPGGSKEPAPSAGDELRHDPHDKSRESDCKTCREDPVDVATGRMTLPQTDLVLPGSLPLVLSRTFESSYRLGRWFGPTWACTVDQRLEFDDEGVVLVSEDGSLLGYPHPSPDAPVFPHLGRRWPLEQQGDSSYTVTDPDTGRVRHFTEHGLLLQIDDRNGAWISFTYDEQGAPLSITHSGGYEVRLSTSNGRITSLALADGTQILHYGYTDGHLTEVTNSSGRPLRFGYDELGRITSWTDTNDRHFDYVYDDQHRCTAQSGTNGHLNVRFTYEPGRTTLTDSLGHTTQFLVNDRAQITAEIDPTGATTRFEHDRRNRLLARTDPLGRTTRFTYDEAGRMTSVTRPDGRRSQAEYTSLAMPVRVEQPDGRVILQTYDRHGNRTSVTDPSGATTHFGYNTRGHLASVTDALGHTTTVRCDPAGRITSATDPLGATTSYERDAFGRPATITDPLGRTTRLTWSVEGRLLHRVNPDGTRETWTYDGEGNCLTHVDAMGGITVSEYGDFDLLTARTGPDGTRHTFDHDTQLRLTSVTNPQGLTWGYAYDPAGRLASETDFDGRTLAYAYDAAGQLASRTNALGETTMYKHNLLGQTVRKDAAGQVTTYAYDSFDALAAASSPDGTISWLRDGTGRLLSEMVNGRTVTYAYDVLGRRTSRTTPTGVESHWTYDEAGRRSSLTTANRTLTFERDAAGQELARGLGSALALTHEYDLMGRRTAQLVVGQDDRTLQRRGYTYRADGYLTGSDDSLTGPRTFTLDTAARVTAVEADSWSERYAYDEAGNQTSASWPTGHPGGEAQGERAYKGTRITHAGAVRYEHDALGRVVLRQKTRLSRKPDTWRYEWNTEDRVVGVVTPDGTHWHYRYDPLGRRTAKQRLSETGDVLEETLFIWDGATLCEETRDALTLTWTHQGLHPLTQTERIDQDEVDDRFFAIVTDLVGTPTHLLAEDGTTAWHTRSTLWGTTTWNRDATAYTPLRFPGQYYDPESGLHYNVFRTYDPETARYLSPDPLGLTPAPNSTTYVPNPHTWSDPLGLMACEPGDGVTNRDRPPVNGDTNYIVDNPEDWADTITDIDRIEDGIFWEEKSATGQNPNMNVEKWTDKHVMKKLDSYLRARSHLEGWEQAPLGIHFVEPGATPAFRSAVESAVDGWRLNNPGVEVKVRWSE
ncbi:RHS repeat protein [Streptomyces sp. NBC_00868]|uniref:putative T7SS-secreted protein n=1 Tax=Streptomyces sp. NBC_00868 TaxID=2903683 RepID=UPI00386AD4EC|nr:RHS repeat protein [Streptomyces sp. NBC_00868]